MRSPDSVLLLTLALSACLPELPKPVEGATVGDCVDGADNDEDGAFDCNDSDCAAAPDCSEDTGVDTGADTGADTGTGGDTGTTSGNAAPNGLAVVITPASPGPDDPLNCTITTPAVDPDGDTVSYRYAWTVDGASAGITAATVASTVTEAGQTWTCTVTPTDGTLDGASASASVEIVSTCDRRAADVYGDGEDSDCDGGDWDAITTTTGTHYVIVSEWRNQAAAAARCTELGYDRLAEFHSATEAHAVWSLPTTRYFDDFTSQFGGGGRLWIGLSGSTGYGRWPSGTSMTDTFWDAGEPNGDGDCVELDIARFRTSPGVWNDISCGTLMPFVCELR
jgi:hypothetical protein